MSEHEPNRNLEDNRAAGVGQPICGRKESAKQCVLAPPCRTDVIPPGVVARAQPLIRIDADHESGPTLPRRLVGYRDEVGHGYRSVTVLAKQAEIRQIIGWPVDVVYVLARFATQHTTSTVSLDHGSPDLRRQPAPRLVVAPGQRMRQLNSHGIVDVLWHPVRILNQLLSCIPDRFGFSAASKPAVPATHRCRLEPLVAVGAQEGGRFRELGLRGSGDPFPWPTRLPGFPRLRSWDGDRFKLQLHWPSLALLVGELRLKPVMHPHRQSHHPEEVA
jgi:hypothetical protein